MIKPSKKIIVNESISFHEFDFACKKVSLSHFMKWCKEKIPARAQDVTLELVEDWQYDSCFPYLELSWKRKIDNPHYEKELRKYEKELKKERK